MVVNDTFNAMSNFYLKLRASSRGTFVYHGVQKINLFTFCQFNIPCTFDSACSLFRSFGVWPKLPGFNSFSLVLGQSVNAIEILVRL